jgi:hypothetical protein
MLGKQTNYFFRLLISGDKGKTLHAKKSQIGGKLARNTGYRRKLHPSGTKETSSP